MPINYNTFTRTSMSPSCSLPSLPVPRRKGQCNNVIPSWRHIARAVGWQKRKFKVISEHIQVFQSHYLIRSFLKRLKTIWRRALGRMAQKLRIKAQGPGREGRTMGSELLGTWKMTWDLTASHPFPFKFEFPSWGSQLTHVKVEPISS